METINLSFRAPLLLIMTNPPPRSDFSSILYEISPDPQRKLFLDDLFSFMHQRGTPINRLPIMAKQVLDLYELFNLVVARGGLVDVINKKLWQEIIKGLNLPSSITSAAFTLRTQYMKYLFPYECAKRNLATKEELDLAIDGNRREGRRTSYGSQYDMPPVRMVSAAAGRRISMNGNVHPPLPIPGTAQNSFDAATHAALAEFARRHPYPNSPISVRSPPPTAAMLFLQNLYQSTMPDDNPFLASQAPPVPPPQNEALNLNITRQQEQQQQQAMANAIEQQVRAMNGIPKRESEPVDNGSSPSKKRHSSSASEDDDEVPMNYASPASPEPSAVNVNITRKDRNKMCINVTIGGVKYTGVIFRQDDPKET
ncbi:Hypothetical predicted protein [Cloeon dipterum]|uniref:ARID domain-containing protein n=1 Tax=Cloeon dipterum TaxID=197152 RepID=A0A8S1DVR4_9INSE|nr:Hypothetical predicted protein [Cloeon dipterum]